MALVARPRWGNVATGGVVATVCAGMILSMVRLGRTTPLVLFAFGGFLVGLAIAATRRLVCAACRVDADEGVLALSTGTAAKLRDALARKDTDEAARLFDEEAVVPYRTIKYGYCRSCRQAARLKWKGAGVIDVDGPPAAPVVAALEEKRRMLRSGQ
jgi:hypothetical protein